MKKIDALKVLGLAATGLGILATMISNYVSNKEMEKTVEEKVAEALSKHLTNN